MVMDFTASQLQRLKELGVDECPDRFESAKDRNTIFEEVVRQAARTHRKNLRDRCRQGQRHSVKDAEINVVDALVQKGFVECLTPIIIKKEGVQRMGITEDHPLWKQIFWLNDNECLRPMLAPNLYCIMRYLEKQVATPIRLFEVGPCFRKESQGCMHLEEFTMINAVEIDPCYDRQERISELVRLMMEPFDIEYSLVTESSDVYGETVDVLVNGTEVASASYGPHKLDKDNGVVMPWTGVGMGLERLVQQINGESNIKRVGRSLVYLDGVRLDI